MNLTVKRVLQDGTIHKIARSNDDKIKKAIWLYFWLLLFEGALRKWFLPGLANPLLIIRDPVALWILLVAWKQNRVKVDQHLIGTILIGIVGLFTAIILAHQNLVVALFGARILLIHFPLVFVIAKVFTVSDVLKMGTALIWITVPMTILIAFQFYSPQSAWVNLGVGGDESGAGLSGALGYFRPPATFSFTNGTTQFFSLSGCFILYFWLNPNHINKAIHIAATVGLLAAIPLSISRSLFFQFLISLTFMAFATLRKSQYASKMILVTLGILVVLFALTKISIFQTSMEAFEARFTAANTNEGGIEGVFLTAF